MPTSGPLSPQFELHLMTATLSPQWPHVPADTTEGRALVFDGPLAEAVLNDPRLQRSIESLLSDGESPLLACLCPAVLTEHTFQHAWRRLVTEGDGTVAWAVERLLSESTPAQRATLSRADYLACLTSPAGDVRCLGQQFASETYVLPDRPAVTARGRLTGAMQQFGRRMLRRPRPVTPWTLPAEEQTVDREMDRTVASQAR